MANSLAGKLLVAMPAIGDPRFAHAVILMCSHDEEHAMGVVINRPKEELTLSEVMEHLGLPTKNEIALNAVLDGGPVAQDRGYVLHSDDFTAGEATQEIAPGIRLTATRDVLEAMSGKNAPHDFVLALGCAGWGAGQLENELKHNAWLIVDPDKAIIFDEEHEAKWTRAIRALGFDLSQLIGSEGGRA
ncbi:MAG TPA: YqgE/AlgH family protein [Vitreimonas sp.]|uniref:YqgE/AlgH family protein n=1 Tax=Vitreimonas sp. TaxID=3069702 RepID=UPI002D2AA46B|nr:YqgE/AlgH family protein [Vitreimonas sp.]HYD89029.1 YqgE/AlgH family protein [Vitreimonas sp.]